MIRDGNLFVLKLPGVLEHVGKIGSHVQDVLDAKLLQDVQVRGVLRATQIQMRQDLHGKGGLRVGQRAPVRIRRAARISVDVRLDVGRVGADPQPSEPEDLRGRRGAAAGGAVEVRLAKYGILGLEFAETTCEVENSLSHTIQPLNTLKYEPMS